VELVDGEVAGVLPSRSDHPSHAELEVFVGELERDTAIPPVLLNADKLPREGSTLARRPFDVLAATLELLNIAVRF